MAFFRRLSLYTTKTASVQDPRQLDDLKAPAYPEESDSDGIRRDSLFYYVPLIILVEGTLFKVSRAYFERSNVFRDTYLRSPKGEKLPDGLTDEQPLRLEGVDASEFKCLIKATIQQDLGRGVDMSWVEWSGVLTLTSMWKMTLIQDWALSKIPTQIHSSNDWIGALKLSTQLKIQGLRKLAIEALTNDLSPSQKIELAMECKVEPWLFDGYAAFVNRFEGISEEEEEKLGWDRASNLFRLRNRKFEQLKAFDQDKSTKSINGRCYSCRNYRGFGYNNSCDCQSCSTFKYSPHTAVRPRNNPCRCRAYRDDRTFEQWYNVGSDIRKTFASEFADIVASDNPPLVPNKGMDPRTATDTRAVQRDGAYYFVDTIFLVEDTLFKVPRHLFENTSIVFRDMFQLPAAEGVMPDGTTDDQPIRLEGVHKTDFRQLLKAMKCPTSRSLTTSSKLEAKEAPMHWKEWVSVLKLSCMWQMDRIREMAIMKILQHQMIIDEWKVLLRLATKLAIPELRDPLIQKLSPILLPMEMVELGIECQMHTWLLQGYSSLAQKAGGITMEDEKQLGYKTTSRLFRVREVFFRTTGNSDAQKSISDEVKRLFSQELMDAGWDGN